MQELQRDAEREEQNSGEGCNGDLCKRERVERMMRERVFLLKSTRNGGYQRCAEGKQNQNTDQAKNRASQAVATFVCYGVRREIEVQRQGLRRNCGK